MVTMASHLEIDSFISKYRYLCSLGYEASLTLKSNIGQTRINFEVDLGFMPPPFAMPPPATHSPRRRSPAYDRRLKRRCASRLNNMNSRVNSVMSPTSCVSFDEKVDINQATEEVADSVDISCVNQEPTNVKTDECINEEIKAAAEVCCDERADDCETEDVEASDQQEESSSVVKEDRPAMVESFKLVSSYGRYGNATYVSTMNGRKCLASDEGRTMEADSLSAIDRLKILTNKLNNTVAEPFTSVRNKS